MAFHGRLLFFPTSYSVENVYKAIFYYFFLHYLLDYTASLTFILCLTGQHTSSCASLQGEGWLVGWTETASFFIKFKISPTLVDFC